MANPKIQLKYKTDKKKERDTISIEINTEAQNLLKKVVLEETVQDNTYAGTPFERYKVKQFVANYFDIRSWFRLLFSKELLTTKKTSMSGDLSRYVEWYGDLRGAYLKQLLEKIYAFGEKECEVEFTIQE